MSTAPGALSWRAILDKASAPYAEAGRIAGHFARGKLRWDPVFRHLLEHGLIAPRSRVLDIGCGRGLLASLLHAAGQASQSGLWPAGWAAAPDDVRFTGIDVMASDVAAAGAALGSDAVFVCGDMRSVAFPAADTVVILDALHYIEAPEQDAVLLRVRGALGGGGRLMLRVGDAASRRGFATSLWVDRIVCLLRGHGVRPRAGRTLAEWQSRLCALGFDVSRQPLAPGKMFANVLLVGTIGPAAPPS